MLGHSRSDFDLKFCSPGSKNEPDPYFDPFFKEPPWMASGGTFNVVSTGNHLVEKPPAKKMSGPLLDILGNNAPTSIQIFS